MLLNLIPKKGSGSDTILPKGVFRSEKLLRKPLTKKKINAKLTKVKPIYKNPKDGSRLESTNYRPISVFDKCQPLYTIRR